jgi:hypothetical protein
MTTPHPEASAIFYRLRREHALSQPSFRPGELYRLIGPSHPEGYVFVELNGRPRCVWSASFERVEVPVS